MKKFATGFNRLLTAQGRILYKLSLVALALALVAFLYQEFILHSWTQTNATITGATASYSLDNASTTCTADYHLSYKIGEKEFVAKDRARATGDCAAWGKQMEARVGATEPLLYNPVDPSVISVRPGYNSEFFFLPLLLLSLAGGLVTLGFFCLRTAEWSEMEESTEMKLSVKAPPRASRTTPTMRRRA
jgi:hypothetical protein